MLAVDNHGDGKKTKNRSTSNFQNEARDGALTGIIIPSLPYYGHVAAGPNGQPTLPDPSELMEVGAVNESRGFVFEGQTYQVDFIHKGRMSVSSHDGHKYGWLKVRGHSMDKAQPIPMKPDDLVLFKVMHELENSVGQIVVACMRDWDTQEPQLVVKRLERLYSSEANSSPSFGLFSESSYNLDPKTGVNYRNPIPIVRDGQVWGQVIAIAVQNQGGQFF
jgi:hypothetical protein